jgi:hypothetical protein
MTAKKEKKNTEEYVKLYVPELVQLVESGDEKMCLIMAQLEYWFGAGKGSQMKYIDGFYKFMTPSPNMPGYRSGDSWEEEMGMSASKIKNALKFICTHYKTLTDYKKQEGDKFQGKFYCSYYHKPSHQTYYLRNHGKVNAALKSLSLEKKSFIFREKHSLQIENSNNDYSGNQEISSPEVIEGEVIYTETTSETNTKTTTDITQVREENSSQLVREVKNENQEENKEHSEYFNNYEDYSLSSAETTDVPDWMNRQKSKIPFPTDFKLTEDMIAWAKDKRPKIDVRRSTEKFQVLKADSLSNDWLKDWQMWILREYEQKSFSGATSSPFADAVKRTEGMFNNGESWGDLCAQFVESNKS